MGDFDDFDWSRPDETPAFRREAAARHMARIKIAPAQAKDDDASADAALLARHDWEPVALDVLIVDGQRRSVSIRRLAGHPRLERMDFTDIEGARQTIWYLDGERCANLSAARAGLDEREKATGRYVLRSPLLDGLSRPSRLG